MEAYRDCKFIVPLTLTSALDLVVFSFTPWPSYHRERTSLSDEKEAGWTPEPVRTFFRGDLSFAFAGIRTTYRPICISLVSILITLPRLRISNSYFFKREHTFPASFIICPITIEMCPTSTSNERACPPDQMVRVWPILGWYCAYTQARFSCCTREQLFDREQ